jgi:hypothetical protein
VWGHQLKLSRARQHFKELESEVFGWLHVDGCATTVEPYFEPPDYVVWGEVLRDPQRRADDARPW